MLTFFKTHIKNKIAPKRAECLEMRDKYLHEFKDKNWVQIKVFVYNTYKNKRQREGAGETEREEGT